MRTAQLKTLRVGVVGAGGRMGQEIARILAEQKGVSPFLGVDPEGGAEGYDYVAAQASDRLAKEVDVWIDFSTPAALKDVLAVAIANKTPVVCGTTGLSDANKKSLRMAAKKIPVLWASNMSLGVAVLNEALQVFARIKDFDFQIEEIHHRRKKDKPSGTAKTLQENLSGVIGRKPPAPLALRGGGVFGVHKVWAFSEEEVLMFEHSALNRSVFAKGAVTAAKWLSRRRPGFYGIKDVLLRS